MAVQNSFLSTFHTVCKLPFDFQIISVILSSFYIPYLSFFGKVEEHIALALFVHNCPSFENRA